MKLAITNFRIESNLIQKQFVNICTELSAREPGFKKTFIWRKAQIVNLNKSPAQAFTPPAEKKMGTKLTFMYMQLLRQW